jgi:molybdopterin-guanine dinucleotide biosynthesis protein A
MGSDKAFLRDQSGQLLLAQTAAKLASWFGSTILVADDPQKLAPFPELSSYRAVGDLHPLTGPVGAIRTALLAQPGQTIFILAGDQPILDLGVILQLKDLWKKSPIDIALPRHDGSIEPLYAFYGPNCAAVFERSLAQNQLAIRRSFPFLQVKYLDLDPDALPIGLFKNLNTPAEAQALGYQPAPTSPKTPPN